MAGLTGFGSTGGAGGGGGEGATDSSWVARRIQAIAATNPEIAADPSVLLNVALNDQIPDQQLVGAAAAVSGDAQLNKFIADLRATSPREQIQWWNKLATPQQQQTLKAAGYNPRSSDLLALGAINGGGVTDDGGGILGGIVDAWDWGKQQVDTVTPDALERPFDSVRHFAGAGATVALEGLNYPFQKVQQGVNATLYQASRMSAGQNDAFFTGWGDAWRISGTDENFRVVATEKANELLGEDPLLYEAAVAQANGQDPIDFISEKYGYDPQTPELQQAYGDFVSRQQALDDPNAFGEAVKTLAFNRATFGQDVANLFGFEGGSKPFLYTSAAADIALALKADPLLVFGKLRVIRDVKKTGLVYRATNGAQDAIDGMNPLLRSIDSFRDDANVVRKFDDVTSLWQKVKAGDEQALRRMVVTEREFARAVPTWVQWEARGNKLESADDLFDWFSAVGEGGGLQPLMAGWFRKARHIDLVLPRYTNGGEAFARTKLATLGRLDLAADKERIVAEVNRLGEGFAAQHLSPDQFRAIQDGSFIGLGDKILAPLANLGKRGTLQIRRSQGAVLLDDSAQFFGEIERWIDEGHIAGQSFIRRNQVLRDMLLAPNAEQRRVLASAYMQDMAEASGVLKTQAGRDFWSKFLDHDNQAYTWEGWDRIGGSGRNVAILPNMQTSTAIAVPSFAQLADSVAQTHIARLFTKINADGVSVALSRFWKVPVLLRLGFISRAAGEEYLSFMLARPEEARAYLRASIAAQPEGAIFLPVKPFLIPLRATAKVLGTIAPTTGRRVEDATNLFGQMVSVPFAGPVRWWAKRGADQDLVGAIRGMDIWEDAQKLGMGEADVVAAWRDAGLDPYMMRSMVEGFTADVSARHHGLTAKLVERVDEQPSGIPIDNPRGPDLYGEFVADRSRYVAYPNVAAPSDEAVRAAANAGIEMADKGADFFPSMFVHRNEELWRDGAVRNALEELSRRYVGPRVEREMALAWGGEGAEGRAAFDEFRSAWSRVDPADQRRIAAVFKRDRVDQVAVDQLAAQMKGDAAKVVDTLRHEGVSANTIEAALGDLRDGHLVYDRARAADMFKGRIAAELQDPANRDQVEQMVRAFTDSRGRRIAVPVADGQTPMYGIVADAETNRALERALSQVGGRKPNPGDWPAVSGSRDLPAFDQHWGAFHDARDADFLNLVGSYVEGGATSVPVSAWATHDHRRAEALRRVLEREYGLEGRLTVGNVNVETKAAREGIGTPIAPDVVHRIEGGAANDLYLLGPGSLPVMEPLTEGAIVDWARAVDDTTVANVIRLAESDPAAFDRLMAAARADFHTNHTLWADGKGFRNPAAMSRDAFMEDPAHALLDRMGQELNRHFGRDWSPETYTGLSYDSGIAQAAYREHDDYLANLADGLRGVGRPDLADEAASLRRRVLGEDRPSVSVAPDFVTATPGPVPELADWASEVRRLSDLQLGEGVDDVLFGELARHGQADMLEDAYGDFLTYLGQSREAARSSEVRREALDRLFTSGLTETPEFRSFMDQQLADMGLPEEFTVFRGDKRKLYGQFPWVSVSLDPGAAGDFATAGSVPAAFRLRRSQVRLVGHPGLEELIVPIDALREVSPERATAVSDLLAGRVEQILGHSRLGQIGFENLDRELRQIAGKLRSPDMYVSESAAQRVNTALAGAPDRVRELWGPAAGTARVQAPPLPSYENVIHDVQVGAERLHAQWLDAALGDKAAAVKADPVALWDDLAGGGAPSIERLVASLPEGERPLAEALLNQLGRHRGDARTAALQRAVLDPLAWARGEDAPAWARRFADEIALVHRGEIDGSLEQTLARRATLPTAGVLPGDLYDDWAEIISNHVDKLLFAPDGQILHAVTQPAMRGHTGLDVLARVDPRDLPAAVLGPALKITPDQPVGFGQKFDQFTGKMFGHIGDAINQMARKPLYISNYVRESASNRYFMDALIDKAWKSEAVSVIGADKLDRTSEVWRMLGDVDVRAVRARARESVFQEATRKLADQLHGEGRLDDYRAVLDRLLELSPQERVALGRHFDNVTNARKVVADAAMTRAVTASVPFIDDHNIRSQYANYMRNLQPFFFAEEQFYKRWMRTIAMRPEAIQRGQQYMMGLRHAGVVHQDENGQWVFTYPGSAEGLQAVTKALRLVGVNANMPVDMELTGNVRRTLPGVGQFGAPGFGPLLTVPVSALAMALPEAAGFDLLNEKLQGPWANRGLVDQVVPATYSRLWAAATHDPEKDPQMASAMFQAVQLLSASGQVPDGTDPAEVQVFLDRARNWARTQLIWRAALGFVGPASPGLALDDNGLNEEARRLIGGLGMEEGLAELVRRHPDFTAFDLTAEGVSQTTVPSRASLPATAATTEWLDSNEGLLKSYPNAGLFLMPPPDAKAPFDIEAYYHQIAHDYRVRRSLDDTWREMLFRRDAPKYFDTMDRLDRAYAGAATPQGRQTVEALKKAFGDEYRRTHPVFAEKLLASEAQEQRDVTIAELGRLMADPSKLPPTEMTRKVGVMWQAFQNLRQVQGTLRADQTRLGTQKKAVARNITVQWGDAYAQRNPEVRALWERVLRPAVERG